MSRLVLLALLFLPFLATPVESGEKPPSRRIDTLRSFVIETRIDLARGIASAMREASADQLALAFTLAAEKGGWRRRHRQGASAVLQMLHLDPPPEATFTPGTLGPPDAARLWIDGRSITFYRFAGKGRRVHYYEASGNPVLEQLMQRPLRRGFVSSRFGQRFHPLSGIRRHHAGVDFAAPYGTSVMASDDGIVTVAGWVEGYGLYVRIRHDSSLETVYAHLGAIAPDIRIGKPAQAGQIIGFVGSTGLSTGPHLHYEIHAQGSVIDPQKFSARIRSSLHGPNLAKFMAAKRRSDTHLDIWSHNHPTRSGASCLLDNTRTIATRLP